MRTAGYWVDYLWPLRAARDVAATVEQAERLSQAIARIEGAVNGKPREEQVDLDVADLFPHWPELT